MTETKGAFSGKERENKKKYVCARQFGLLGCGEESHPQRSRPEVIIFYLFYNLAKHFKEIVFHVSITEDNLYMNVKGTRIVFTVIDVCVDIVSNGKR